MRSLTAGALIVSATLSSARADDTDLLKPSGGPPPKSPDLQAPSSKKKPKTPDLQAPSGGPKPTTPDLQAPSSGPPPTTPDLQAPSGGPPPSSPDLQAPDGDAVSATADGTQDNLMMPPTTRTEVAVVVDDSPPTPIEVGIYAGTFISNYFHQYYELEKFPSQTPGTPGYRPELRRFSPLFGLRFAYFFKSWMGAEVDLNMVLAETKAQPTVETGKIISGRLQLIFQLPNSSPVVPYVSIGDGFGHLMSDFLGSDTDYPPFLGAGARFLVHRSITLRIDGRWMRAPTVHDPYTLNCNLGELMFGVSFRPSNKPAEPPPPPPPPAKDSDADGIVDDADRCKNEAEDTDLFDDSDGCPDPDNDADGILDAADQCPLEAEDKDGFQDENGCLDKDNDADGVVDTADKCIAEPEDKDGFQDIDGCAELDNDNDSFADDRDKCPNEAEVINGTDDDDGCPDQGFALVVLQPDRLETMDAVIFKKLAIQKDSLNLLGQIGATLRAHPEILRLRITVHVHPTKKPDDDKRLSELRAHAIREWLIKYGIDEKRLEPRGFGGTKPLVDPKKKGAKALNERVDFIILEKK